MQGTGSWFEAAVIKATSVTRRQMRPEKAQYQAKQEFVKAPGDIWFF